MDQELCMLLLYCLLACRLWSLTLGERRERALLREGRYTPVANLSSHMKQLPSSKAVIALKTAWVHVLYNMYLQVSRGQKL